MRELIYTPIILTEADMGLMSSSASEIDKLRNEQHEKVINMWKGLREKIDNMNLAYGKVKIYQDSLPVSEGGMEKVIVEEVAKKGSLNHILLADLVKRGASLVGTEDSNLLLEGHKNYLKLVKPVSSIAEKVKNIKDYKKTSEELLSKRDEFIAKRIESTLADEEIGILFVDIKHKVDKLLKDIKVSYLIYRLPFKESFDVTMGG